MGHLKGHQKAVLRTGGSDDLGDLDQGSYMDYVVRRQIEHCWRIERSMGESL